MLRLQNVRKSYKTKAGNVNALDCVSLNFPSSGLVFITGKSGCGKTTLLNVIGGLDGIDDGEILVQDKNFSNFSAAEYDSYRNTFIGFIFQEYNLLPEFTVKKNIEIAMELQGRKANEAELEALLKDMEIEGFKTRYPFELSGGQRQRVAIARALVKQPRIILADEPTGALDSGTGIQVLDTLKKLSKDKLVIVVSHDREFAEKYADRIIHLVDGKVAQDVTFTKKEIASNVSEQEGALIIREGAELSENEKETLANAIKERKKIEVVENLCFRDKRQTGEIVCAAGDCVSLRKSKMKLKSAAYLGLKSLAVKPLRLVLTILISALAFAVFALFDTIANFSTPNVLKNQLNNALSPTIVAYPDYIADYTIGDRYSIKVSESVIKELDGKTGGKIKGIFDLRDNTAGSVQDTLAITELISSEVVVGKRYYANAVNGFVEFEKEKEITKNGKFKDFDYSLVYGEYPELIYENGVLVEDSLYKIAISTYLADSIIYYLNDSPLNGKIINTYKDLIGATITVGRQKYTITGLIDCGEVPIKYDILRQSTPYNVTTNALLGDFNAYIDSSAKKCLFVAKDFLRTVNEKTSSAELFYIGNSTWTMSALNAVKKQVSTYIYNAEECAVNKMLFFDQNNPRDYKAGIADDEILIHYLNLETLFAAEINALGSNPERLEIKNLIASMGTGTAENNRAALAEILNKLQVNITNESFKATIHQHFTATGTKCDKAVKLVGVYFGMDPESYTSASNYKVMMNENLMRELGVFSRQGEYSKLLFSARSVRFGGGVIVNYFTSESGLTLNWYNNFTLNTIKSNEIIIRQVANLFLYAAIALALLSVFMLYNYMSTSIANKKQSVGVLRGLGAGGKDIFLTFLCESLIVAFINGILANLFAVLACALVNAYIVQIMHISVHFALFGGRQIFIIILISLLTAISSSALPIFKICKKKPVELIRRL